MKVRSLPLFWYGVSDLIPISHIFLNIKGFDENSPASIGDREIHAIVPRITDEELVAEWMSREEKFRYETYAQVQSLFDGIKDSEKLIRELRDEEQCLKISLESMKRSREDDLGPLRRLVEELKLIT